MATKKLTATTISHVKAPEVGRIELWDSMLPGFGLRVTENDARTWFIMYRSGTGATRKQRRLKLGDAKIMDLAEARDAARDAFRELARGKDPARERRSPAAARFGTMHDVANDYLARYAQKNTRATTYNETKRVFNVDVLPALGNQPIGEISRRDVGVLLEQISSRGAAVQANRTLASLKTFFGWCVDEEIIPISPVGRMKPATKERARDRALADDEIRWFWQACGTIRWPFGPLFQLLLLTAQRRDEVAGLAFAEIDLDKQLWTIPRERAKNDRAHEVSLSSVAREILTGAIAGRPKLAGETAPLLVFTTNGTKPVSGFSCAKERLDTEMEKRAGQAIADWTLHDLRRTAATGMAKLNIAPHVVDRVLNHVSGTIRGVAAVYNRHAYIEERQAALEAWTRYVENLVIPEAIPSNVIPIVAANNR